MPPASEPSGARILIVDDQTSNIRLLEHTLRRAGYTEVMSTTDPCQVMGLHEQHSYDLILLDVQMPEMTGFEVLAELQAIRPAHPVAVLVISAGSVEMPAELKVPGDDFLSKPFRLPDVVDRVQGMLKARGVATSA